MIPDNPMRVDPPREPRLTGRDPCEVDAEDAARDSSLIETADRAQAQMAEWQAQLDEAVNVDHDEEGAAYCRERLAYWTARYNRIKEEL